jgi:hypothetical protein
MKTIKITALLLFGLLMLNSCKDDFFDVNVPSNYIAPDKVEMNTQLPYVEVKLADMQYLITRYTGEYDQQIAGYSIGGADIHDRISLAGAWYDLYAKILNNLRVIKEKASAQNNKHYLGIAQVLEALAVQMATDQWGDIPYSEAAQGTTNLYPKVDSQQDIYPALLNLLDQAIANLQADGRGIEPGSDDVVYHGDLSKWIKAAYTLKARLYMHMTKRDPQAAANALAALQNGFTSNGDDFQVFYDETYRNPWYTHVVAARRTGNLSVLWGEQLIDKMNGVDYPFDSIAYDPRLPKIADNGGASVYTGAVNGSGGLTEDGHAANADLADCCYFAEDGPIVLLSFMEAKFLEAEAQYINNGNTGNQAAYDAYIEGIKASMNKLGVNAADRDAYLAEHNVGLDGDPSQLTLEYIMKEKYIALLLSPEIWTDMRRYDYDPNIFKDLKYPQNRSTDIPDGVWPERAVYPNSEVQRNPNIDQVEEWWQPLWLFQ